jgi:hypothetical protein
MEARAAIAGQPRLLSDQRGAIVLMGVFMSVFLVGALWYVIGISHAIVYRESVQTGADATAFSAAVYHARGMNMISMVNIVIGAVMAIAAAAAYLMQIAAMVISVATQMCALAKQPSQIPDYSKFAYACDAVEPAKVLLTKFQAVIRSLRDDTSSSCAHRSVGGIGAERESGCVVRPAPD